MEVLRQKNVPRCNIQYLISPILKLATSSLFVLFILCFSAKSHSQDIHTELGVIDQVKAIEIDTELTHPQKIDSLNSLISLSQSNNWWKASIASKILKIELMLNLELTKEAMALVDEIKQHRYDELTAIEKSRVVRACLLYTSPSPRDLSTSRMPSSA